MKRLGALLLSGGGVIALAAVFHTFFFFSWVDGPSMAPTLGDGQLILVSKRPYGHENPQRGDIVVCRYRDELIVKRVLGLEGEDVEIKRGRLFLNGSLFPEEYLLETGYADVGSGKVGPGKFAVCGDNRDLSPAEIIAAIVSKEQIVGKVVQQFRFPRFLTRPLAAVLR